MKNKALYVIAIIVVLAIGFKVFIGGSPDGSGNDNNDITGAAAAQDNSDAQIVNIGFKSGTYVFSPSQVEAGKPVILKNDGTLKGCAHYIVQKELGINANFASNDEYRFTPTKKGDFRVACTMNMYSGTLKVI